MVTGLAGSGKSTLSLALAAKTSLPDIHLDLHFWKPGWVAPSETEWRARQCDALARDAWIADGNYHETLDLRLERADTVVFLDMPWWRCSGRALLTGCRMPGELPEGCHYSRWSRLSDEWRLAVRIWRKNRSQPEREHEIISQHGRLAEVGRTRRPVLVLTRTEVLDVRALVTVAEVSTSARGLAAEVELDHVEVGLDHRSVVNCDGLHTIARTTLRTRVGEVDAATLERVCSAVSYAFGC